MASKRALVSVYDKTGLLDFVKRLNALGYEIVSTGGTAKAIADAGVPVTSVADVTGFPEILGGRVKTLHPKIHGGILAVSEEHMKELEGHSITPIDIVVCNLYPFNETVARPDVTVAEAVEQIDIGGVTILRAAAKNFERVVVVSSSQDYAAVADALESNGVDAALRKKLATKAFRHTAAYDCAISEWLSADEGDVPETITLTANKLQALRYGENPHQQGALYTWAGQGAPFEQLLGKELSYNNILDVESAWNVAQDFPDEACVVIVKHNIACGLAVSADGVVDAYDRALASDPVSAFGSIIAVNREITLPFVERVGKLFVEAFISRSYSPEALEWLAAKKKNCRVLVAQGAALHRAQRNVRSVIGGLLVQSADNAGADVHEWKVVTEKQPTPAQMADMKFAWIAAKHVKSNAIVFAKDGATVGVGAGQPNRVDAVGLAAAHAGERAKGASLASDAFFPFADGIEKAAESGISCVVQPGGSVRDDEVVQKANELGLVMVFTGRRHFRH